jgi:predicted transcriptional regulator
MPLSNSEEQLIKHLWRHGPSFLAELIEVLPEPRPAKTTISTLLKRMIDKQMVGYKTYGNSRQYYALVSKQAYFGRKLRGMIDDFFDASPTAFASLFAAETEMTVDQLRELQRIIDEKLEEQ